MKHKDPFLGEIELKKLGETSRHLMGESIIETIYIDAWGNYYIDAWLIGSERQPMKIITKKLFDRMIDLMNEGVLCEKGGYELAYPKASEFMNNADEELQKIINKLTNDEWETLRDRFADFYVAVSVRRSGIN